MNPAISKAPMDWDAQPSAVAEVPGVAVAGNSSPVLDFPAAADPGGSVASAVDEGAVLAPRPVPPDSRTVQICDRLKAALRTRLKARGGEQLASFEWKGGRAGMGGRVDFQLTKVLVDKRKNAVPTFCVKMTSAAGATWTTEPMGLQVVAADAGQWLRLRIWYGNPVVKTVDLVSAGQLSAPEQATSPGVRLSGTHGVYMAELGAFWFGAGPGGGAEDQQIERQGDPYSAALAPYWPRHDGKGWWMDTPPPVADPFDADAWTSCALAFSVWTVVVGLYGQSYGRELGQKVLGPHGLPPRELYALRSNRPVELDAADIDNALRERDEPLHFPWHVIEAACTSLNAGMHVILTGPPGCGKTELAVELARHGGLDRGRAGLLATASPAWTTGDLIGRYFPERDGKGGLTFRPGFFLRAIDEGRWLIIDEFNRAPIDSCFGELFTVLSKQTVELPYEAQLPGSSAFGPVRVLAGTDKAPAGAFRDYRVPAGFRLLGTMNDADRHSLQQLSFALLRRVDIIRVEAPPATDVARILDGALADRKERAKLADYGYLFQAPSGAALLASALLERVVHDYVQPLFAHGTAGRDFSDLVAERVVGIATAVQTVQFLVEGVRTATQDARARTCSVASPAEAEAALVSYLAMAVVLKVLPQLDSLERTRRQDAIRFLLAVFAGRHGKHLPFMRILRNQDRETGVGFALVYQKAWSTADRDGDGRLNVGEYLVDELCRTYRDEAADLRQMLHGPGAPVA